MHQTRVVSPWRSSVGVAAVADIDDGDGAILIIDDVSNAVFPAARTPLTFEWLTQWRSDSVRIGGEGTVEELHAGDGGCFREPFGQLPCRRPRYPDSVLHRSRYPSDQRAPGW